MGAPAKVPFPLLALCATLVFFPLVAVVNWQASYAFYAMLVLIGVADAARYGHMRLEPSWPTMAKWLALLLSAMIHARADGQLANFGSLVLADVALLLTVRRYAWELDYSRPFFRALLWTMIIGAVLGFMISSLFAGPLLLADPVRDLLNGQRVRIYVPIRAGHSMLADYAFVAGLLAIANLGRHGVALRGFVAGAAVVALISTSTAASWLLIGVLAAVFAAENVSGVYRMVIYGTLGVFGVMIALNPDLVQNVLSFVRLQLLHRNAVLYGDDLTAGRQLLNRLFLEAIRSRPIFGVGHDDRLLLYGTQVVKGRQLDFPISESPFRFAAEYGAPAGLALLAFVLAPLRAFNAPDRGVRVLAIGLSFGVLAWMSANTLFSIAHAPQYVLYGALLLVVTAKQFRAAGAAAAPKPTSAPAPRLVIQGAR